MRLERLMMFQQLTHDQTNSHTIKVIRNDFNSHYLHFCICMIINLEVFSTTFKLF